MKNPTEIAHYDAHETARMHAVHGAALAPFQRRAAAFLLDLAFGSMLAMLLVFVLLRLTTGTPQVKFRARMQPTQGEPPAAQPGRTIQLRFFNNPASVGWWVLYFGLATYVGNGRTPGKRLMRIRVVSLVHERLSLWHSFERALGYGASLLEFGFGFLQYFIHPNRRTVHDRIADTIVVYEPRAGQAAASA